MTSNLEIIGIERLRPLLDRKRVLDAVRQALILQAEGKVQSPLPGQLLFKKPYGECHIKYGHVEGGATFAIKVANGFYENSKRGLPTNHGLILVFDAETGVPRVLFNDQGWMTAWRTAAATAIAAETLAPREVSEIGIIGTGLQGGLAIEWIGETLAGKPFAVWGRNEGTAAETVARAKKDGRKVRLASGIKDILSACNVIVTATPANQALFAAADVRPGTHIVGIGADTPGKQEIPAELFPRAAHILCDDRAQCIDHGDVCYPVRNGLIDGKATVMLGDLLSGKVKRQRKDADISIADLTGIAAEDIAIAGVFSGLLKQASAAL